MCVLGNLGSHFLVLLLVLELHRAELLLEALEEGEQRRDDEKLAELQKEADEHYQEEYDALTLPMAVMLNCRPMGTPWPRSVRTSLRCGRKGASLQRMGRRSRM